MSSLVREILEEWEGGCFYTEEHLADAYTNFLLALLEDAGEVDARAESFLKAGFEAYLHEQGGQDPQAHLTYRLALAMVGGRVATRATPSPATPPQSSTRPATTRSTTPEPRAATPELRSATPPGTPPRPASPQPSSSKRAREDEGQDEVEPLEPTLEVIESRERYLKRFKSKFRDEVMVIKGLGNELPSESLMEGMFNTMLERQKDAVQAKPDDRAILEIQSTENAENPLWFSLRRVDQLDGRVILDKLSRVLNSNQNFFVNGQLKISFIHISTPEGGGRRTNRVPNETMEQWVERKIASKSIFSPDNTTDEMCFTRSVAVAIAHGTMSRHAFYRMKQSNSVIQRCEAKKLCETAGLQPNQRCGLDEVQRLQDSLRGFRLCVFTDKEGKECVFKGQYAVGCKNIYLLLHREHFYAILYPGAAFDFHFECEICVVFYNNKGDHRCDGSCWRCFGPNSHVDPTLPMQRCTDCFHSFPEGECFDTHKIAARPHRELTRCQSYKFCVGCEKSYSTRRGQKHACGFVYCQYCKQNVLENHLCYMSTWNEREKKEKWNYITIYYDIETTQCDPVEGKADTFEHKPNLLVTQAVCDKCCEIQQNDYFCTVCKNRQNVFHNLDGGSVNVMGQFLNYLQSYPSKTELLIVAHNAKSFDGIFVLQEVIARKLKPELVLQGAKIICMKIGNWKFIDSLMFLPMPLSAMPKSFGLQELKKGYWPFLANKPEFYTYEGPLLDKEFYCVSGMKSKVAADFSSWYDEQTAHNFVFNFRRELIDYCISDVTILRQSCQAFRKLFNDVAGFDPMFNCITLSSACMAAYRRNFLPEGKIGIVPPGGYHGRGKQSHVALQWLDYESHRLGEKIKTIYTDREVSVLGRRVDGYVEVRRSDGSIERRIYQFHGDYWHNCPTHFPANAHCGENRYDETVRITSLFRRAGFTVIEKWECQWKSDLDYDPDVKAYFQTHPTTRVPPLVLRDALCGGRTSAYRWYHKANLEKGEKIKFADVISEYPNANLRGSYPVGHPTIFLEHDPNMPPFNQWNGLIKCTILPPRDLSLPVLPFKAQGKLMFPLCRTCVETEGREICHHNDPLDRQLTGTWCAPELHLALEKGYTLVRIHEVYQYPESMQFNPETGEDGLLSAYVRCFMALKVQASGWPDGCDTPEKREEFIKNVKKYDGIVIDPEKMERNPALRTLAKLILNSFWGKFGEKTLRSKTEIVYDYSELMQIVIDPTKKVQSLVPLGDECLQVAWKPVEDSDVSLPTSSLVHAAFTTCLGRLQLYRCLQIVGDRALYGDTDSVAYISRPNEPDLPLGSHLGDLSDQVVEDYGPGSFIVEFCAGGPKNYGYVVAVCGDLQSLRICIKVRGITINKSCEKLVTYEELKKIVMGDRDNVTVPIPRQIARLPTWQIVTRPTSKNWRAVNTKRRRVDLAQTVPHGFNAWHEQAEEDQDILEAMDLLME